MFTKPPGSYEFCGFSFRKNQERASKFGSIWAVTGPPSPGFSKQLFGSSREGTELDWTCFKQFLLLLNVVKSGGVGVGVRIWWSNKRSGFSKPRFVEPLFCTLDAHGFHHFRGFHDFR